MKKIQMVFFFTCWNCEKVHESMWQGGDFFCSGIVKHPRIVQFDIIRICKCQGQDIRSQDMSPDEALSEISVLNDAVNKWLHDSKKYQEFRQDKGGLTFEEDTE
jgi:hypothetical protein